MICPKCEAEYLEGVKVCADCNVELISKEEYEKNLIQEKDWDIVYTTDVRYEAEMLKTNLESANIKTIILSQKDHSFPTPGDLAVIKLIVRRKDFEDAKSIISDILKKGN